MKRKVVLASLITVAVLMLGACQSVPVEPKLGTSLGYPAYKAMGAIKVRDAAIGIYIEPELANLILEQKIQLGEFKFQVGEAFSAKLTKAVAHNFRTVVILDSPSVSGAAVHELDAIMRVAAQDMDFAASARGEWSAVSAKTYMRAEIRAEIRDIAEDRIVWVGTTTAQREEDHKEHGAMSYQEAGRGFGRAIDNAIDLAVGDLLSQIQKSSNLKGYFERWEAD